MAESDTGARAGSIIPNRYSCKYLKLPELCIIQVVSHTAREAQPTALAREIHTRQQKNPSVANKGWSNDPGSSRLPNDTWATGIIRRLAHPLFGEIAFRDVSVRSLPLLRFQIELRRQPGLSARKLQSIAIQARHGGRPFGGYWTRSDSRKVRSSASHGGDNNALGFVIRKITPPCAIPAPSEEPKKFPSLANINPAYGDPPSVEENECNVVTFPAVSARKMVPCLFAPHQRLLHKSTRLHLQLTVRRDPIPQGFQ
jgi:hypothetical protein